MISVIIITDINIYIIIVKHESSIFAVIVLNHHNYTLYPIY